MAEEQDNKKPKATLIKHQKADNVPAPATETGADGVKKAVVVVKKKTVVKKKVVVHSEQNTEASAPSSADKPAAPKPADAVQGAPKRLTPDKIAEFAAKRPQEMRRVDPAAPKPEGMRFETGRPPRSDRPQGGPPRTGDRPQGGPPSQGRWGDRSSPGGNPAARSNDRYQGGAPQGERPRWGDRSGGGQGGGYGNRPPGQGGGYGNRPPGQGGGYGNRPPGQGGGYGNRPPGQGGGYGNRPPGQGGGYGNRPPGQGGGYGRPGGGFGRPGGAGAPPPPSTDLSKKVEPKKFRSKKEKSYSKEKEELVEKAYQFMKKQAAKANPVPKEVEIMEVITVAELARKMNLKASDLITKLMSMGMLVTINEQIDAETASILASEFGTTVKIVSLYEETLIETEQDSPEDLLPRPPIVTIMGHVDHGKTKLLDAIRTTNVAAGEHGGITQHIGAYMVHHSKGDITFLDTPGHEAFTLMRARGAQITDIVVLVVAANDGVMPQTLEAIDHAKEAKVPIIVAINKVDLADANPDRVRQQLSDRGLIPESWGGQTMYCEISALKKVGLDELMDHILLQAEVLELKASLIRRAEGKIIESKIDQGRGVVASVIVQKGVLKVGDYFVGGVFPGKVRAMFDDRGRSVKTAGPSMPVEILGFDGIPGAGDPFNVTENEKSSKEISEKRQELNKVEEARNVKKVTLANLYSTIQAGEVQELKVIIKGDVHGSVEALRIALENLSTAEIRLNCIRAAAGAIIEDDVNLASASQAIIIGFHVRPTPKAQQVAEREKVEVRKYNIIYDAVEDIRTAMEGMLSPELKEEAIGQVEVRDTFKVPKIGVIAGCMVIQGKVRRNCVVNVIREGVQVYSGKISSLKRFKDDAKEVTEGYECGIGVENYQDLKVGDILEVVEVIKVAKKLGETLIEAAAAAKKNSAQSS